MSFSSPMISIVLVSSVFVAAAMGARECRALGGAVLGERIGALVGDFVGDLVGDFVGDLVGLLVGGDDTGAGVSTTSYH